MIQKHYLHDEKMHETIKWLICIYPDNSYWYDQWSIRTAEIWMTQNLADSGCIFLATYIYISNKLNSHLQNVGAIN